MRFPTFSFDILLAFAAMTTGTDDDDQRCGNPRRALAGGLGCDSGIHRTGTAGDAAGADWLAAEARALGAEVAIEEVALDRLDPVEAYLEIGGERIDGVPVFDAPASEPDGIAGRLGADIAVAELSPRAVYSGEFQRLRRSGLHRALVVICKGDAPGFGLINAEDFRSPYGAPAIHVSSEARDQVLTAARDGAAARLRQLSAGDRERGRSNICRGRFAAATGPSRRWS